MDSIIIEDGYNTSYLTSLLVLLFYNNNKYLNNILTSCPIVASYCYLQELITDFINKIYKGFMINVDTINEIKNFIYITNYDNIDIFDYIETDNMIHIYELIINNIVNEQIIITCQSIVNNSHIYDLNNCDEKKIINYIDIELNENSNIKTELNKWFDNFIKTETIQQNEFMLYKFEILPHIIGIHINRIYNTYKFDITKCIKFEGITDSIQKHIKWRIHGFLLKNNNKYYTLFYLNNNWIKYEEGQILSFNTTDLNDINNINKYMSDVVFILYILDDDTRL